jgi:hypothetical protein
MSTLQKSLTGLTQPESTPLADLQSQLQDSLLNPQQLAEHQYFIEQQINHSVKMSAKAHLNIYQRSYLLRLHQCMASQFPALKYALGDNLFPLFVTQYLQSYPSESYTLNSLGDRFSKYLQNTRPDADQEIKEDWPDFMIELTEFENSLSRLFDLDVPDTPPDEQQVKATLNTPDEDIQLVPVLQLFEHQFSIADYYRDYNDNLTPDLQLPQQSYSMILRRDYRLGLFDLNQAQFQFLQLLQKEKSIAQAKKMMTVSYGYTQQSITTLWLCWREYFLDTGLFNEVNK